MTKLLPAILFGTLLLVAATAPALAQQRGMEMDTDDMGNLKKPIDAAPPGKAEAAQARPSKTQQRAGAKAARSAVHERRRQCGTEWREARAAGKLERGMTWSRYWSACHARLKAKAG